MAEGEAAAEAAPEATPKKSKKKLIIMVVVFVLIGYVVATKTVLKPPPPTPVELAAKHAVEERLLEIKCAKANGKVPPPPLDEKALVAAGGHEPDEAHAPASTTTTTLAGVETHEPAGPILVLDPVTVNLADGHFLKMAVGFQLLHGAMLEELEGENPATPALGFLLEEMRKKTTKQLGPKELPHLREDLGYKVCVDPEKNAHGQITAIYFTDFVTQ
jgi:flagellar basal body-associated protein FliL